MIYGALPTDLGLLDITPVEMMFWMYCPIATPNEPVTYPVENLWPFAPLVDAARDHDEAKFDHSYVYLTAKTVYVSGMNPGTRPGWHSDGFGTLDDNFIWYDRAPTEFIQDRFTLPDDCENAIAIMTERAATKEIITYPCKHLLALTPEVIHRAPDQFEPGMRTFVKISISPRRYNLEGNSVNYRLSEHWPTVPRSVERNHPSV